MILDPYVSKDNSTKHGLGGLMPSFVDDMAVTCCQSCKTHGVSYVDFDWNGKGKPSIQPTGEALRLNIHHATDFSFPVYGYKLQDRFRHEYGYTGMIESPGIAYIINTKFGNQISTSVVHSIFACWPLALISILLAYISGFAIWAMVGHTFIFTNSYWLLVEVGLYGIMRQTILVPRAPRFFFLCAGNE